MRISLLLIFLLTAFAELASGQKFLQLEKVNSPRSRKYFPGDEITFQLHGGQWYTRVIEDVSYERKLLIFASGHVELDSIMAFKTFKSGKWSKTVGNQLYNFAIAWAGYSIIGAAVEGDVTDAFSEGTIVTAGASVALGYALQKLFKSRTFRLNKNKKGEALRWRLRALDLTVKRVDKG